MDVLIADHEVTDTFCLESRVNLLPADPEDRLVQDKRKDVVGVRTSVPHHRSPEPRQAFETTAQAIGSLLPRANETIELFQLFDADRALDLAETEVITDHLSQIAKASRTYHCLGMVTNQAQAFGELVFVRYQNPPFARVDVFVEVETIPAHVGERSGISSLVEGPRSLRRIGDDLELVLPCDGHQGIHVGGVAEDIDRNHGPGVRRDVGFNRSRIEAKCLWLYVGEHRNPVPVDDGRRACTHRPGAYDDLVPRLDPHRPHCGDQPGRPGIHGHRVLDPEGLLPNSFELLHLWATVEISVPGAQKLREDPALDHFLGGLDLVDSDRVVALEGPADRSRAAQ